jgi:hypothetical protein
MRPGVLAVGQNRGQRRVFSDWEGGRHLGPTHVGAEREVGGKDPEDRREAQRAIFFRN